MTMKNFINVVRKSGPIKTRKQLAIQQPMVDAMGNLTLWSLMDEINKVRHERISALKLDEAWKEQLLNMDVKMYANAELGDALSIESCFVQNDKKSVDLKVYVSKHKKGQPAKRVCKAVYTVSIQRK